MWELSERLVRQNISVTVYCHKNLFHLYPTLVNNIDLKYIKTIEKKTLSQFFHTFQSMIHTCFCDYDIILVLNSANGPFGLFSKLFRKKTAINVDGLEWLRPKWKGLGAKYFYTASKLSTILYDEIVTDSFEMQKIYKKEFGANSTVITYGANIRESKNPELIQKWNLSKNDYYLIVGRLVPDNNADIIVKEFVASNTKKKLVVVGDVPYNDTYANSIKNSNDSRIVFTGYVTNQDELAELYHNCFIYLHGHEFGGTNPAMLKALAYGCAVMALDTVFTREMLAGNRYGLLFNKDTDNLKSLIQRVENQKELLTNLRNKSRRRIIENYTWDKITEQYLTLFRNMMKKSVNQQIGEPLAKLKVRGRQSMKL